MWHFRFQVGAQLVDVVPEILLHFRINRIPLSPDRQSKSPRDTSITPTEVVTTKRSTGFLWG